MASTPPRDTGAAPISSSTPTSTPPRIASPASASASTSTPQRATGNTAFPLAIQTGLPPPSSSPAPSTPSRVDTASPSIRSASASITSPTAASPSRPNAQPRRPRRPSRCYSLEVLREEQLAYSNPTSPIGQLGPTLPTMPESESAPNNGATYPPASGSTPTQSGFPVPHPAPAPLASDANSPSPTPAPTSATPTSPIKANRPRSSSAAAAMQASRTRGRAHTVSITMPSRQLGQDRLQPYRGPVDDIRRESLDSHEGGSAIGVRLSSDDGRQRSGSLLRRRRANTQVADDHGELTDDAVGLLDCVDDEVSTLNHLQNVTNGIMFPNIPQLWSRRPTLVLAPAQEHKVEDEVGGRVAGEDVLPPPVTAKRRSRTGTITRMFGKEDARPSLASQMGTSPPTSEPGDDLKHRTYEHETAPTKTEFVPLKTISKLDEELSDEVSDVEEEHELDTHLRKVLQRQQRKEKLRAALKGLWAYLKTPMGVITAIYGINVVFWGAAIVFFLAGWIPVSSKNQNDIWIEISSQVVNGLFTVTGVGLIPWRAIDTYRMSVIWTLRKRFERQCKAKGLPPLEDPDDLPDPATIPGYDCVLTDAEHDKLVYQQEKFAKSQTWYRPHANATHRAFPMSLALWNTILMDGNSFFQCILCGCMWGMNRHQRPAWTTGTLIPCSFLCGIGAAVLIWQGGKRTKKKEVVEEKLRKALGVDEPIPITVKKPRRATVTGAPPKVVTASETVTATNVHPPKRASTVDGGALPVPPSGEYQLDRSAILGAVDERYEEPEDVASGSSDAKDINGNGGVSELGRR